jgi:hypothetical protein
MSAEQLINDELVGTQLRRDLHTHSEPVINDRLAMAGWSHEIKIDESDRILNSSAFSNNKIVYVMLILGALAATGVPWMIIKHIGVAVWFGVIGNTTWKSSFLECRPWYRRDFRSDA